MPTHGPFRFIRQPIYLALALTLWTVPVSTPDQLALAICFTAYCLFAPRLKERRFALRYGNRFQIYKVHVPCILTRLNFKRGNNFRHKRASVIHLFCQVATSVQALHRL